MSFEGAIYDFWPVCNARVGIVKNLGGLQPPMTYVPNKPHSKPLARHALNKG